MVITDNPPTADFVLYNLEWLIFLVDSQLWHHLADKDDVSNSHGRAILYNNVAWVSATAVVCDVQQL